MANETDAVQPTRVHSPLPTCNAAAQLPTASTCASLPAHPLWSRPNCPVLANASSSKKPTSIAGVCSALPSGSGFLQPCVNSALDTWHSPPGITISTSHAQALACMDWIFLPPSLCHQKFRVQVLPLSLNSYVIRGKLSNFSELWFPHLYIMDDNARTLPPGFFKK